MDQRLLRILGGMTERYPHNLERDYPRVFGKIMSLWDSPDLDDYFMELMFNERSDRAGFPPEVASEIMHLNLVHTAGHPKNDDKKRDLWDPSETLVKFVPRSAPGANDAWANISPATKDVIQKMGVPCTPEGFLRAAEAGNRPVVGLFLDAHANTESRDERGWTPLLMAAFNGHLEIVGLLLQHGAHVQASDLGGNTALHWAAFSGHVPCAKLLIENHANVDARSSFGLTPLLQAAAHRHLKMIQLLLEHGADPNVAARDGWTALHKAAANGSTEIIWPLIRGGAHLDAKNLDGDTPIKLAIKNKQEAILQILMTASESGGNT